MSTWLTIVTQAFSVLLSLLQFSTINTHISIFLRDNRKRHWNNIYKLSQQSQMSSVYFWEPENVSPGKFIQSDQTLLPINLPQVPFEDSSPFFLFFFLGRGCQKPRHILFFSPVLVMLPSPSSEFRSSFLFLFSSYSNKQTNKQTKRTECHVLQKP